MELADPRQTILVDGWEIAHQLLKVFAPDRTAAAEVVLHPLKSARQSQAKHEKTVLLLLQFQQFTIDDLRDVRRVSRQVHSDVGEFALQRGYAFLILVVALLLNYRDYAVGLRGSPSLQLFLCAVELECDVADGRVSIEGLYQIVNAFFAAFAWNNMERLGGVEVLPTPYARIEANRCGSSSPAVLLRRLAARTRYTTRASTEDQAQNQLRKGIPYPAGLCRGKIGRLRQRTGT